MPLDVYLLVTSLESGICVQLQTADRQDPTENVKKRKDERRREVDLE